jgi:hypothetical protein
MSQDAASGAMHSMRAADMMRHHASTSAHTSQDAESSPPAQLLQWRSLGPTQCTAATCQNSRSARSLPPREMVDDALFIEAVYTNTPTSCNEPLCASRPLLLTCVQDFLHTLLSDV